MDEVTIISLGYDSENSTTIITTYTKGENFQFSSSLEGSKVQESEFDNRIFSTEGTTQKKWCDQLSG